jgi:hypothetical protein
MLINQILISVATKFPVPVLIHDDPTRIFISLIGLLILSAILYRVMRYYGGK